MTPERWQQINALLDAVLDLPPGEQQAYLDVHCPDPELRREVQSLLQAHDEAQSFLEEPAKEYAAPLIPMTNDLTPDPLVGQEIDGYRILDVLGRGGMGVVYKALDINLDKVVALKMIDPALARDETFVHRFRTEARALARIDSPHIVRVYAMRQTEVGLYIIMEYVDGGTVTDLLSDGPLPWLRARPIIQQMLTALEHAHGVYVIHRDIKPSNIMLTSKGVVKVTDFGLAKVRLQGDMATITQGIAGTLFYMSPEQVVGLADLDHRSDLYSMGMTIYQMLAGRLPLDRDLGDFAIMRAIVEDPMPLLSTFIPSLPEPVVEQVMKALEKEPADPRRRALWIGGGVLGVAALALAAFLIWLPTPPPGPPLLSVSTIPNGALVSLNGRSLGTTPFSDRALSDTIEQAVLHIEKTGYVSVDTTVDAGASVLVILSLEQRDEALPTVLAISSNPGDARVQIDGEDYGSTDGAGQLPGVHMEAGKVFFVEIFKEGYTPWSDSIEVEAGDTLAIDVTLESVLDDLPPPAMATLTLRAQQGCSVSVEGENCSLDAPCRVRAGLKRFTLSYQGQRKTETLELKADTQKELTCYVERKLNIQVRMEDGQSPIWATILVDGVEIGPYTDRGVKLEPGEHRVEVRRNLFEVLTPAKDITVEPAFEEKLLPVVFRIRRK